MLEFRRSLPAYKEKNALMMAISNNQVCLSGSCWLVAWPYVIGKVPLLFSVLKQRINLQLIIGGAYPIKSNYRLIAD